MGRSIFLANPELNADEVAVTHSSALGRRAGEATAVASNSGWSLITALGDAGDGLTHSIKLRGNRHFPRYIPRNDAGADLSTALETFTTMASLSLADVKRLALVTAYDRLHLITLSGSATLSVYAWGGSAWSLRRSITVDQDIQGGIAACSRGENIYIGICDSASQLVSFYRYSAISNALGMVADGSVAVNSPGAISMASNEAMFCFLHEYDLGGGLFDVRLSYSGNLERMRQRSLSFLDMFEGDWVAEGNISSPFVCWSPTYKFLAGFQTGVTGTGGFKVAQSFEGDDWTEFEDIIGTILHPTITTPTGNAKNVALAPEGRRLFTMRATAATLGDPPTNLVMQYFNGRTAFSAEIDMDAGLGLLNGTGLAIANWRGSIWGAWASASGTIQTRKWNTLSTNPSTDAGHSTRSIEEGEPNFIDGPEDDSRTALFFYLRGDMTEDDEFTIPTAYDHRGANTLSEVLGETWRGELGDDTTLIFDRGVNRKFRISSLALIRSNMPSVLFEISDQADFSVINASEDISGTWRTAAVVSGDADTVSFAAGTFRPNEFKARTFWAKFVTGVTGIFRILDNTGDSLLLDGDATGAGGTVTIFRDSIGHHFDEPVSGRYVRLTMPDEDLPDGFFEIARSVFGRGHLATPRDYAVRWRTTDTGIASVLRLKSEAALATQLNVYSRRTWRLRFPAPDGDQVAALLGFFTPLSASRDQMAFWPEGAAQPNNVYLVRVDDEIEREHRIGREGEGEGAHEDVEVTLVEEV